jgi:TetR/AcrR family acrAB operon transcriptional repressor
MRRWLAEKQAESGQSLADTKTRILDAAARVFARYGYAGASLEQVAADAGMTKGAVYWHFSSKSDLFLALCERSLTQQLRSLPSQAHQAFSAADPIKALAALLQSQFACCEQGEGQPLLFFEFVASSREPAVREKLRETYGKILDGTVTLIKELQEKGLLADDVDPQALSILLQALVHGILLAWIIDPGRVQFQSLVAEVSRVLWKGLEPLQTEDNITGPK